MEKKLLAGAHSRAKNISKLYETPQVEGFITIIDQQSSLLTNSWTKVYAKLNDSVFLCFPDQESDSTPTSVFLVEDAVVNYNTTDIGSLVLNSSIATEHKFSLTRPSTGRKLFISTSTLEKRDAWVQKLLSTGSAGVQQ